MSSFPLLAMLGWCALGAGCIDVVQHRTVTVVARQPLEPYVRRIRAQDKVILEKTSWEGTELAVRVVREQISVEYGAERQTIEETTVREPVTWVPVAVHASLAALSLAAIVGAELTKPYCRGPFFDEGCGGPHLVVQVAGTMTFLSTAGLFLADLHGISDSKKKILLDVPSGALQRRVAKVPMSGERVTLRFPSGDELAATTDAHGVARWDVPADKARPGVQVALSLGSAFLGTIELGAAGGAP